LRWFDQNHFLLPLLLSEPRKNQVLTSSKVFLSFFVYYLFVSFYGYCEIKFFSFGWIYAYMKEYIWLLIKLMNYLCWCLQGWHELLKDLLVESLYSKVTIWRSCSNIRIMCLFYYSMFYFSFQTIFMCVLWEFSHCL
jgi:hypothetical protein